MGEDEPNGPNGPDEPTVASLSADGATSDKDPQAAADPAATQDAEAGAIEDHMTLDAFEAAVSAAISDRLGDPAAGIEQTKGKVDVPKGADEMVAGVLAALTGQNAKSALEQVRAKLRNPDAPDVVPNPFAAASDSEDPGNVIDLQAARDARDRKTKPPSEMSLKIGEVLKQTFSGFLANYAKDHASPGGQITLDADFLKENGPQLLGNIFQGLAGALIPGAGGNTADPDAPKTSVQLRAMGPVDLAPLDVENELAGSEFAATEPVADTEPLVDSEPVADMGPALKAVAAVAAVPDPKPSATAAPAEDAPTDTDAVEQEPEPAKAKAPPTDITVKFDVGSLIAGLFKPRTPKS
ncbi:MAG: hypothetical protein ACI9MR_002533 [Myxococcota bacterium]|jgi:hypothetical protein